MAYLVLSTSAMYSPRSNGDRIYPNVGNTAYIRTPVISYAGVSMADALKLLQHLFIVVWVFSDGFCCMLCILTVFGYRQSDTRKGSSMSDWYDAM